MQPAACLQEHSPNLFNICLFALLVQDPFAEMGEASPQGSSPKPNGARVEQSEKAQEIKRSLPRKQLVPAKGPAAADDDVPLSSSDNEASGSGRKVRMDSTPRDAAVICKRWALVGGLEGREYMKRQFSEKCGRLCAIKIT